PGMRQHVRVAAAHELVGALGLRRDALVPAVLDDDRLELGHGLRVLAVLRRDALDGGVYEKSGQLFVAGLDGVEFVEHADPGTSDYRLRTARLKPRPAASRRTPAAETRLRRRRAPGHACARSRH